MNNLFDQLKDLLLQDDRFMVDDDILKNRVTEFALKMDPPLIKLLLSHPRLKKHFFVDIDGTLVFDQQKFIRFVNNKAFLPDSYTSFKNKIGLTVGDDYFQERREVALVWPYKDCVLQGGQTKEEAKRDEIFWNEILAPDEIDRLFDPKILTNFKRYDIDGEHSVTDISDTDSLIIKGNNLLALHSLKKRFAGKVKLIYIDPPYNTGNDSFGYNDHFNHSTWLTFMKNRLEIAESLLSANGVIFLHCDNNEQGYLKVLMDDIFGRDKFIETITVVNNPRGRDYGGIANMHEFILVYSKTGMYEFNRIKNPDKKFKYKDDISGFDIRELRNRNTAFHVGNRPNLFYPFFVNPNKKDKNGFYEISLRKKTGWIEVLPKKSQGVQTVWRWGKEKSQSNINVNICAKSMQDGGWQIIEKYRENSRMARSVWWDKEVNSEKGTLHLKEMFGRKVFNHPKPEGLLYRILTIGSNKGDLILDFFAGSGTTAAVAHKMGRQFITVEQMDYTPTITVERLKKVVGRRVKKNDKLFEEVDFDRGGISKNVDWQGGGNFIYCELMQWNQRFIDQIETASTSETLQTIWQEMQEKAFLSYQLDIKQFDEHADDFAALNLDDQKEFLLEILDKNQLYVNLSEMDDITYGVSEKDKMLNRKFYRLK